ncbi:hypothetical protein ScPMuIL_009036, partial [Solemya velum]
WVFDHCDTYVDNFMSVSSYPVLVFISFRFSAWTMASFLPPTEISHPMILCYRLYGFIRCYVCWCSSVSSRSELSGSSPHTSFSVVSVVLLTSRHVRVQLFFIPSHNVLIASFTITILIAMQRFCRAVLSHCVFSTSHLLPKWDWHAEKIPNGIDDRFVHRNECIHCTIQCDIQIYHTHTVNVQSANTSYMQHLLCMDLVTHLISAAAFSSHYRCHINIYY